MTALNTRSDGRGGKLSNPRSDQRVGSVMEHGHDDLLLGQDIVSLLKQLHRFALDHRAAARSTERSWVSFCQAVHRLTNADLARCWGPGNHATTPTAVCAAEPKSPSRGMAPNPWSPR